MNLFVYGTLLFPEIRELIGGRPFRSQSASLGGFEIFRVKGATFPGLLASTPDCLAKGEVLFDLTDDEMARFDNYEDSFYRREKLDVTFDADNQIETAMVYVVPVEMAATILTDEPWTAQWFDQNHRQNFFRRISGRI